MKQPRQEEPHNKWAREEVERLVLKRTKKERIKREKNKAYLLFSVAILIAIACALLYVFDSSWFTLINPLAVVIIIAIAIWVGVMYLGQARAIKHLW